MEQNRSELSVFLHEGDPAKVAACIEAGADIRYQRDGGYDALIDAVHGRDVSRDPRLLDLLKLLIARGVTPNGVTSYKESALRVLSRVGRFDAVRLLLDAGSDRAQLKWTPLMEAVALGSLADVEALVRSGAALEEKDWWSRTAWLIALLGGDVAKAKLLLDRGANAGARGRGGQRALAYAVAGHHPEVVRWLLESGQDVNGADDNGVTPLMEAVEAADLEGLELLLAAGADVGRDANGTALQRARTRPSAMRLLAAGADPANLTYEGRRALVGLAPDPDESLLDVSPEDFQRACTRAFGNANPQRMQEPFWESMIRSGITGYAAGRRFGGEPPLVTGPIWCAQRFGQSITFLPDGRIVQIAGEHEDAYDPDFCIYNDVFVHGQDGTVAIYGYPESVFPPTDFHTATLVGEHIYLIGSLGYFGTRRHGSTPVYRLDVRAFSIERLSPTGERAGLDIRTSRDGEFASRSSRLWRQDRHRERGPRDPRRERRVIHSRRRTPRVATGVGGRERQPRFSSRRRLASRPAPSASGRWPASQTRLWPMVNAADVDELHHRAEHGPQGQDVDRDRRDVEHEERQEPSDREHSG